MGPETKPATVNSATERGREGTMTAPTRAAARTTADTVAKLA